MAKWGTWTAMVALVLGWVGSAMALSPADKCESSELKTSGKYAFCRLKADAKAVQTGGMADYSKCDDNFSTKFGQADAQGMGQCPAAATQAQIQAYLSQCSDDVATALGGGALTDSCLLELAQCQNDLAACLAGTLPAARILKTGETVCSDEAGIPISCPGTGQDGELQKGVVRSYTDNGDGTITDNQTGLTWEKLGDDGSIHDQDNIYTWQTAVSGKIAALNGANFAGHNDWRLPNINELQSLVNYGAGVPAVSAAFNMGCVANCTTTCSCTQSPVPYWSSTTSHISPGSAWFVDFYDGFANNIGKDSSFYVRAVRGGS